MPGGRFRAEEGANVSMCSGGAKEQWSMFRADPLMGHHTVDLSIELPLRKSAILTYGVFSPIHFSRREGFTTRERLQIVRLLRCASYLRLLTLCLLHIHCSACFSVSRLSGVSPPSPRTCAAGTQLLNFPPGVIGADAADPVAAHVKENSATETGASSYRRRTVLSSPGIVASTHTAGTAYASGAAVSVAAAPAAGLKSSHSGGNFAVSNNVASSSLFSLQQAGSIPGHLPAGYQTYREMIGDVRNLAASQCPELEVRERRSGQFKVDVIILKRDKSSSSGSSSSEKPTQQQQQRVFILTGEHPRELLPPAVLLRFVQLLCGVQSPAATGGAEPRSFRFPSSFPSYGQQQVEGEGEGEKQFEAAEARHKQLGDTEDGSSRSHRRSSSSDEEDGGQGLGRFRRLLDNAEFQIVLNANPSGREKVEEGEYCRRGTINNVDLNRNWSAFWEATTQENPDSLALGGAEPGEKRRAAAEFLTGGPSPFSEPETQLLKKLLLEFNPTLFISVHSGSLGIYTPFGYADYEPQTHGKRLQQVAHSIAQSSRCRNVDSPSRCVTGTAGKYFAAKGNCMDWVYTNIKPTPLAFLLEIYQGLNAASALPGQVAVMATGAGATESESETPFQQPFALAQAEDAERDAANQPAAKEASLAQQVPGTQYQKEIKPHFVYASFRGRGMSLQHPMARMSRPSYPAPNALSSLTRSSNRGRRESDRRSPDVHGVKMSFLQTRNGAASAAAADAMAGQLSSSEYTLQDCFRAFNPHTEYSREQALNNWAEVLRQLVEEAGVPLEAAD